MGKCQLTHHTPLNLNAYAGKREELHHQGLVTVTCENEIQQKTIYSAQWTGWYINKYQNCTIVCNKGTGKTLTGRKGMHKKALEKKALRSKVYGG